MSTVDEVYELVFQTDEAYYPVAVFSGRVEADRVMAQGNAWLHDGGKDPFGTRFDVRPHEVVEDTGDWRRGDFADALGDYIDPEDYFRCDHDWRAGECSVCGEEQPGYVEPEPPEVVVPMVEPSPFAVKAVEP